MITWFAGLFYTPRLFIYFLEASQKKNPDRQILMNQFKIMIYRLWYIITWPSSILAMVFGIWLLVLNPHWLNETWMIVKLGLVILLVIYHIKTHFIQKELRKEIIKYSMECLLEEGELGKLGMLCHKFEETIRHFENKNPVKEFLNNKELYTHPHQWQGLTDDEITNIGISCQSLHQVARAIEQALKDKNT